MLFLVALLLALLQTPQDAGTIEGTVVRAGTVPPVAVARARVLLNAEPNARTSVTVTTDDAGRFSFRDVPPGRYQLLATRDGYVSAAYGRRTPNSGASAITLQPRQAMKDVVLEMTPTSAISGRIRDRSGKPLGNVRVTAHASRFGVNGRTLSEVQSTRTNDLGEFRLYYLKPGRYFVSATPSSGPTLAQGDTLRLTSLPGLPLLPPEGAGEGASLTATVKELAAVGILSDTVTGAAYVPIYFPGVLEVNAASPIDLAPGESFTAVDISVTEIRAARIRGRVEAADGSPANGATVMLLTTGPSVVSFPPRRNGTVAADGTFEFSAVAPGSYDIVAVVGKNPPGMSFSASGIPGGATISSAVPSNLVAPPTITDLRLAASLPVQVQGKDIDDVRITPQTGQSISGKVTVEGVSLEESTKLVEGLIVQLQPDPQIFETAPMPAVVRPDGTFTAAGAIPGKYQISLRTGAAFPAPPYVKSARMGAVDVINPRLILDGSAQLPLEIVIGMKQGALEVAVTDAKQALQIGVTVVLVPDQLRRQHYDLYFSAVTDNSGVARFNIQPGDYTVYAWEDIERGSWWDPEFMQKYQGRGKPVKIDENGKQTVSVEVIPYR